jgi:hypothetical protein
MRSAAVTEAAWCQVVTGPAATLTDWQQEAAGYLEQVTERYPPSPPGSPPQPRTSRQPARPGSLSQWIASSTGCKPYSPIARETLPSRRSSLGFG